MLGAQFTRRTCPLASLRVYQVTGQPQSRARNHGRRVAVESVVRQAQLTHPLCKSAVYSFYGEPGAARLLKPGSVHAVAVIVQEKSQGGRVQTEVEAEEDEAFQVTELLLGEGIAAEGQEVADVWRAHLHLDGQGQKGQRWLQLLLQLGRCANTHLFTCEQQGSRSHQLEAVRSHRRGRQEPVHDVHRQAAALKGQPQIFVQRDEPADQRAPSLCSQLQAETEPLIFLLIFEYGTYRSG